MLCVNGWGDDYQAISNGMLINAFRYVAQLNGFSFFFQLFCLQTLEAIEIGHDQPISTSE
jgi:hypothetical protein